MEYNTIIAKSFSRHEQKKFGYGALLTGLFIVLSFFTVFKPSFAHLPILNIHYLSMRASIAKALMMEDTSIIHNLVPENKMTQDIKQVHNQTSFHISPEVAQFTASESPEITQQTAKKMSESTQFTGNDYPTSVQLITNESAKSTQSTLIHSPESTQLTAKDSVADSKTTQNIKQVPFKSSQNFPDSIQANVSIAENQTKQETKPVCNAMEQCDMKGDVRVHGNSSSIFFASSQMGSNARNDSWKVKPYTRKTDKTAMSYITEFTLKPFTHSLEEAPQCSLSHNVPAIVFSIGGYSGNHFHDYADILVPLFLTSYQFHGEVQFLVTNTKPFWITKYQVMLKHLSNYEIIDIDKDGRTHCFSRVIFGLIFHKDFTIDPSRSPNGYSMTDFKRFLRSTYSLKREKTIKISERKRKKPRVLIITRKKTRSFTNEEEIVKMARSIGFEVVVAEPGITDYAKFAQIVNSCDVIMGVHGAGLTNIVFLPTNAVLIQIVPLLGSMNWMSKQCFGEPAGDMNIRYLEYGIKQEESTLIQQYPIDHAVFKDPVSIRRQGWNTFKSVYLDKQNVRLDVNRFRSTLLEAIELLRK